MASLAPPAAAVVGEQIRVRGLVQGVGFRPTVWRIAHDCGLDGEVCNDGDGVLIRAWGLPQALDSFVCRLREEAPPLARIRTLERQALAAAANRDRGFRIVASGGGIPHTAVLPDAASCAACIAETLDPQQRRYRYPFTNCTHCGPRMSITSALPYDRCHTSMAAFALCADCEAEYRDPADRRFHAQPVACPRCGPQLWLSDAQGGRSALPPGTDAVDAACALLRGGAIVAIKGIGGFQLACDAGNAEAVARLRVRKRRPHKPFALMARDTAMAERYCRLGEAERTLLASPAAPIVLCDVDKAVLPAPLAPGVHTLGFMLPYTPLHHLLMQGLVRPIVLTSGNLSDEPQCADNDDALQRLAGIADHFLMHDRAIVNRIDDSVVRVIGSAPRVLRRARGYAPAPLALADGFGDAPRVLATGGELKSTFCLLQHGEAMLSPHQGDLENALARADYLRNLALYRKLYQFAPQRIAVDLHPDYLSTCFGRQLATEECVPLEPVLHHHAHVAACMAENGLGPDAAPVIGIALDGLGMGEGGELWGGEFLLADYRRCRRLARLRPVALPGGAQAMREPWRNTYAQLAATLGWESVLARYPGLELVRFLGGKPLATFDAMLAHGLNSPPASSCGRLFDAVAAALGICRERASYEGQAAIELEAALDHAALANADAAYPFALDALAGEPAMLDLDPAPMWQALLDDLAAGAAPGVIAARFHSGLARAIVATALHCAAGSRIVTVALSGGVFQNRTLFELVERQLRERGLAVLSHRQVPPNDGGLALGQAAIAAARALNAGDTRCA